MEQDATGMIVAPVFWAALIIPGFGIFSGPLGPSGVIATKHGGLSSKLTILVKISGPLSELDPLSSCQPRFKPILAIISAS